MKSAEASQAHPRLIARFPGDTAKDTIGKQNVAARGDTNWTTYEVSLDFQTGERPEVIEFGLHMEGQPASSGNKKPKNQVWIKDVELLKSPLPTAADASAEPKLRRLKLFDPKQLKPDWVTVENDAWRIENDTNMGNFHILMATVLDDIPKEGLIVCRAKVKVEARHKYTSGSLMLDDYGPSHYKYDWPEDMHRYQGNVPDWTAKEVRYPASAFHQKNPPQINIRFGLHANGVLWVKDLELLHLPAEQPAATEAESRPAKAQLLRLKLFDPQQEKPVPQGPADAKSVTVEGNTWRIENDTNMGNFHILMATVLDGIPKDGHIVCRAKVKVKAPDKATWGDFLLGDWDPSHYQYDWPAAMYEYRGDVPEWTAKEVRYPASVFHEKNPPQILIRFGLHANGVLWVKDLELLHLPAEPVAPPPMDAP